MDYKVFLIRNLTNMHVGSGDNTFGVVDKLVQRDPVSNYPTIHSSSLKGALREFFKENLDEGLNVNDVLIEIFGGQEDQNGKYKFFSANILGIPVRSNNQPFFIATTPSIIKEFLDHLETFSIKINNIENLKTLAEIETIENRVKINGNGNIRIEDWETTQDQKIPESISPFGRNLAIFSETNFKELTKNLPVIARNNLENGKSTNLWYEEIVPRETLFYFFVGFGKNFRDEFETTLQSGTVQIGANASIGYGVTKITKIGG